MSSLIDISLPLREGLPIWPGSPGLTRRWLSRIDSGDSTNGSWLAMDVHVGTHVDAPLHFLSKGASVERLDLDTLVGPAVVVDLTGESAIDAPALDRAGIPRETERLLLRTDNSKAWAAGAREFREDYVALTVDGARWVVDRGIRLVGIDYLSIQRFQDGPETHQVLLGALIVVVEGLDLHHVDPGQYELLVLPLNLPGAEGAPARALLRTRT